MSDRMFDLLMQKNDEAVVLRAQLAAMTAAKNKAVEALKRANSILEDEYPATDCRHPRQWRLDKLIAELEAV